MNACYGCAPIQMYQESKRVGYSVCMLSAFTPFIPYPFRLNFHRKAQIPCERQINFPYKSGELKLNKNLCQQNYLTDISIV